MTPWHLPVWNIEFQHKYKYSHASNQICHMNFISVYSLKVFLQKAKNMLILVREIRSIAFKENRKSPSRYIKSLWGILDTVCLPNLPCIQLSKRMNELDHEMLLVSASIRNKCQHLHKRHSSSLWGTKFQVVFCWCVTCSVTKLPIPISIILADYGA